MENAISKSQYLGQGQKLKVVPKVSSRSLTSSFIVADDFQVNPDIRGGLVVEIGDRTIDLSVSGKLNKLNKLLRDTI